jgi:outer membrane protein
MKKFSNIASLVALAATLALFIYIIAYGKSAGGGVAQPSSAAQSVAGSGVVFVNIDSLVHGYDMYFDLQKDFEVTAKKKDGDFTMRMKKFENDANDFREKVSKGLVTRSQAQQLQEGLAAREQELLQLRQQLQSELQEEEAVLLRQIQNNIQQYIVEYNKDKAYSLILSTNNASVVLYGAPEINITAEVLAGLNESYVKARKK